MLTRRLVVGVGLETEFGVTAPVRRPLVVEGEQLPLGETAREMLANERSSVHQHDNAPMVQGLQRGTPVKLTVAAKYAPSQLGALATAPVALSDAAALSQELLLAHWLGGRVAGRGSTVVSSADVATITVTTGHGSRFTAGQMVVVYVAGAPYLRQVTAVATDTLSLYPDLPASPASGQAVLGSRTYHRVEAQTATLTVDAANYESGTPAAQQRARGVRGQCAWTAEIGQRPMLALDAQGQAYDEGNLSIAYTPVADDMGADVVWCGTSSDGGSYLWATSDTDISAAHACVEKLAVAVPNAWRAQACMSGVEGAAGVTMTGGRAPATVELTLRWEEYGAQLTAAEAAGQTFSFLTYATRGSSTSQAWAGWFFPNMAFDGKPTRAAQDGEVMVVCKFRCLANEAAAGTPLSSSSTDAERSPVLYFLA